MFGFALSVYDYGWAVQSTAICGLFSGRQTETISLLKPENTSLGFSVVGLKDEEEGELGIYVQDIQPAGIAAK